ncbi:TonB-dependent receptor plug domain-containing protein [Sphingomonas sp.]|uniref:TonB-dependent receptor plug domain-containing protein n=1 Tax=Sphingomonas sp. TaxID=28214 RepID=UPI002FD88BD5
MHVRFCCSVAAIAIALVSAGQVRAQQAEVLPETVARGEKADPSYELQPGNDTGTTVIREKEIKARGPGSGDVNQLLKALPTVQFDRRAGLASREAIQDIRPADISISGGRIYENLITIDGIDANTRLDVTENNPQHFAEPAGNAAQNLWLDSNLVGEIVVRDSNVSAEFGRFTGGALDIRTRDPKRHFGGNASLSYTADALVDYRISEASRAALGNAALPERPSFRKWRFGASVDLPVSEDVAFLVAANRSRADVTYRRAATYGGTPYGQHSLSDNLMLRGVADLSPSLKLTGQFTYSPYESQSSAANGINNLITSKGGGLAGQLQLDGSGTTRWSLKARFSHNDSGRTAPPNNYSIPSSSTNGRVCSSTNCTIGGFGNVDQWQNNIGLSFTAARDIGTGELRGGVDYQRVEAMRSRPQTNNAFSRGTTATNIACGSGDSLLCATGQYALTQYSEYRAYRAEAALDSVSAWAEYSVKAGPVDLRGGLRYDYESFLGNHNVAPRLSATLDLPWQGWAVTAGANRYYGRSMLGYALREQYPDNFTYRRTGVRSGASLVFSDAGWTLYDTSHSTSYANADLKTPYSDELTGAVTGRVLGGTIRLKGVFRWAKDEFSRSSATRVTGTLETGATTTYTLYTPNNDGRSRYRGASLEWTRAFGKHSIAANVNYSKAFTSNTDYFVISDDVEDEAVFYVYNGALVSAASINDQNQRLEFASPFLANFTWTGRWFHDRLTTNVNARYRNGFDRIEVTGNRQTVNGARYEVVALRHYASGLDVNLNAQLDVIRSRAGTLTLDARIANLLNRVPVQDSALIANPYQMGRSAWFGLAYRF